MRHAHLEVPSVRREPTARDHALTRERFWGPVEKSEVFQGYEDI